jgi:diadenosine tetraphosphatase ApaH/serine/threonine PP2A family protein phosphatase
MPLLVTATMPAARVAGVALARPVAMVPDPLLLSGMPGGAWRPPPQLLADHFFQEGRLASDDAVEVCRQFARAVRAEPNVLKLSGPTICAGDVHGQFYDLLTLLEENGPPGGGLIPLEEGGASGSEEGVEKNGQATTAAGAAAAAGCTCRQYVFLGDYVDRGLFSCEVILYLFSLKLANPTTFHMIRGNHESRAMTETFGFREEALAKYGPDFYQAVMSAFDTLPLAAVVATEAGSFFCCHGGVTDSVTTIADLDSIDRFREPPQPEEEEEEEEVEEEGEEEEGEEGEDGKEHAQHDGEERREGGGDETLNETAGGEEAGCGDHPSQPAAQEVRLPFNSEQAFCDLMWADPFHDPEEFTTRHVSVCPETTTLLHRLLHLCLHLCLP